MILKTKILLSSILILVITSCDCLIHKSGLVYDLRTNKPIENAKVTMSSYTTYTDSLGRYHFDFVTGRCPDWDIEVSKEHYKPFKISIKLKNDYIDYKLSNNHTKKDWRKLNSTSFTAINEDSLIIRLEK
jgi:hypothetical protein